jgi:hypothetical protein
MTAAEKAKTQYHAYYERNKEAVKLRAKLYRLNNPEKMKQYAKTSRVKHRDAMRAYDAEWKRRWRREHPERSSEIKWAWEVKRKFGMTRERFAEMLANQDGLCAICRGDNKARRLHIDHDHTTGEIRGLLCNNCNLLLGHALDSAERLTAAIAYLAVWGRK